MKVNNNNEDKIKELIKQMIKINISKEDVAKIMGLTIEEVEKIIKE